MASPLLELRAGGASGPGDPPSGSAPGVGVACSPVTLVRGASSYSLQLTPPTQVASYFAGFFWDDYTDYACNVAGANMVFSTRLESSSLIDGMFFSCASPTLTLSSTNQLSITMTNTGTYYGYTYGGGTTSTQPCGASQVVVGYRGRSDLWADQLQPVCAPLVVNYK